MIKKINEADDKEYVVASWHLSPKVTVGALISAIAALVSSVVVVTQMGDGVRKNAENIETQWERFEQVIQAEREITNQQIKAIDGRVTQTALRMSRVEARLDTSLQNIERTLETGFSEIRNDIKYIMQRTHGETGE